LRTLIAIPVFNERKTVNQVLDKVKQYCPDILVIDDGSTDGTQKILQARFDVQLIQHHPNQGYGQSLIDAFKYADQQGYDWVITMDCDEQHESEMIPEFLKLIEADQWDMISGSRYMEHQNNDDVPPEDRRAINARITKVINDLFGLKLTDSFCGFKAHRVSAMRDLELDEAGYAFPMQLWPRAAKAGLRITELPVRLIYNDPNRHFGGKLDDADYRFKHYLSVLHAELERPAPQKVSDPCGCTCCYVE
jgi:glycosyltransferase involved in cell wall biosynthesis